MKRVLPLLICLLAAFLAFPLIGHAQSVVVVSSCNVATLYNAGQHGVATVIDTKGNLCTSGGGASGAATIADGADVAQGATTDAAATAGSIGTLSAKLRLITSQLDAINTAIGSAIPSGTNTIGAVTPSSYTGSAAATAGATTLAAGATAQTLFTAAEVTHGCAIQNPSTATLQGIATAESIWVDVTGTDAVEAAASSSVEIAPGSSFPCPGGNAPKITWIATTIGHKISAYKW